MTYGIANKKKKVLIILAMHTVKDLDIKKLKGKGKSLFSNKNYKRGDFILLIAGPVVTNWTRYTVPISEELSIDPVPFDNFGRYLNHSCDPNAGIKNRTVVVAFKDIEKGDEITIDYAMIVDEYGDEITLEQLACKCGSKNCRKTLGAYKTLPKKIRKKYKGFISEFLTVS